MASSIPSINHHVILEESEEEHEEQIKPSRSRNLLSSSSGAAANGKKGASPSPARSSPNATVDRALNQKFHVAALTGNLSTLQELLTKARLPVDCRDKENSTALLLACARGHYACAEYLLTQGADPNARRITGASPLYFASAYRHERIVELLLKNKAIIDLPTFDGATPLHVASEKGYEDCVKLLIAQANVNARMNDGTTALMLASQNGHMRIVQQLVSASDANLQRLDGVTAFFLAIQHGHVDIVDLLLEKSSSVLDVAREDGATPLFKACQKGLDVAVNKILQSTKPNLAILKNGETCLHAATMFNHVSIVRTLLDAGADPLLNNWEGMTAVDLAKEGQLNEILQVLMTNLAPKMSEHARQYLMHKSTRRSDADFDLDLVEHEERDEWKLYKTLKSADGLEKLEEEIEVRPVLPDAVTHHKRVSTTNNPHRYHSTTNRSSTRS